MATTTNSTLEVLYISKTYLIGARGCEFPDIIIKENSKQMFLIFCHFCLLYSDKTKHKFSNLKICGEQIDIRK